MKDWFESLDSRERLFVSVGAVVVTAAALWFLVWQPLDTGHKELQTSVTTWQRALAELSPIRAAIAANEGNAPVAGSINQTPVVIVDQTLDARGLNNTVTTRQPTPNGIRVDFEDVAFDDLVLWLGDLSSGHALEVQLATLTVTTSSAPGRINASITLERTL